MRTVVATTMKEGGEGRYNDCAVDGEKCDEGGQEEVGNNHDGEEKRE